MGRGIFQMREGPKNLKSGVRCVLVKTQNSEVLKGYLEDINERVYLDVSKGIMWLTWFFEDILGYQPFSFEGLSFRKLYEFLGVIPEYKDSRLVAIWWPCWFNEDYKINNLTFSVSNAFAVRKKPLINRLYVIDRVDNHWDTDVVSRHLYCSWNYLTEESIDGFVVDHRNRVPTCNLRGNLFLRTKGENEDRGIKREGGVYPHKGVVLLNGKSAFCAHLSHPISKVEVTVQFNCSVELAAMLYDWLAVYLREVPDYIYQIKELSKKDIVSFLSKLNSSSYTAFLTYLWNSGDRGKYLAHWVVSLCGRRVSYSDIVIGKSVNRLVLRFKELSVKSITLPSSNSLELLASLNFYLKYKFKNRERILIPPFIEPVLDLQALQKSFLGIENSNLKTLFKELGSGQIEADFTS